MIRETTGGGWGDVELTVSTTTPLPASITSLLAHMGIGVVVEDFDQFTMRLTQTEFNYDERIRLIDEAGDDVRRAVGGSIDVAVWDGPVTNSGRVEVLPFVHEQAVSITNHRFGNRTPLSTQVLQG